MPASHFRYEDQMSIQCSDGHLAHGDDGMFINAFKERSASFMAPILVLDRDW